MSYLRPVVRVPNLLVTRDRSSLDHFTAAREYHRNSASMGRIDQSHVLKVSGVTISMTRFVISRPGTKNPRPGGRGLLSSVASLNVWDEGG